MDEGFTINILSSGEIQRTIFLEISVMMREVRNRWYNVGPYFLAITLAELPFQIIFDCIYLVISYFMTSQVQSSARFFMFSTICVINSLVSASMGLLIGAVAPSVEVQ